MKSLTNNAEGAKFKISNAIKSMELFGDLRFRYEYRAAQLGPETHLRGRLRRGQPLALRLAHRVARRSDG